MEAFNVSAPLLVPIAAQKLDKIITSVKAARAVASSYVGDGVNGEQIRPPAEVDLALAATPTGGIELHQEPSDLVSDLELPLLEISRCESVGQETALASVLALVDHVEETCVASSGEVVHIPFVAWRRVPVYGSYRLGRGEGEGIRSDTNNAMLLMGKVEATGTKAAAAFVDVAEAGDARQFSVIGKTP